VLRHSLRLLVVYSVLGRLRLEQAHIAIPGPCLSGSFPAQTCFLILVVSRAHRSVRADLQCRGPLFVGLETCCMRLMTRVVKLCCNVLFVKASNVDTTNVHVILSSPVDCGWLKNTCMTPSSTEFRSSCINYMNPRLRLIEFGPGWAFSVEECCIIGHLRTKRSSDSEVWAIHFRW
jgi:hypothetical protein